MTVTKAKPTHAKNADMTATKTAFVEWLVARHKEPKTQTELAGLLGVDIATLSDWKHDEFVLAQLKKVEARREAGWAQAWANLERIACQTQDNASAIAAIKEMGKLMSKYPSEKIDHTIVERVAYVQPGALRELSRSLHPELN